MRKKKFECYSVLCDLVRSINYIIDNEHSYGDEYTAIVLEDLLNEYDLNKYLE